ncbi:MAG: hypothetical protein ACT4QD_15410 [Acidobacteriota bacterium]
MIGCSFTQGWALSDEETYPWKLQQRFPSLKFENYAAAGYSTYQALLSLERVLDGPHPPSVVVYGFLELHEERNVATESWLRVLARLTARGHLDVPFCRLDRGRLVRYSPRRYVALPYRTELRTFGVLDDFLVQWRSRAPNAQKRQVTEELLREMRRLCASRGVRLLVAILDTQGDGAREHYRAFFEAEGIAFVDTAIPGTPDLRVPGDGHPNGWATDMFATNIGGALERFWPRTSSQRGGS